MLYFFVYNNPYRSRPLTLPPQLLALNDLTAQSYLKRFYKIKCFVLLCVCFNSLEGVIQLSTFQHKPWTFEASGHGVHFENILEGGGGLLERTIFVCL